MNFTDFQLTIGINDSNKDSQYVPLLKSAIAELFTTYGIAISKDVYSSIEVINGVFDTDITLSYRNLESVIVKSSDDVTTYVENTDYTINLITGVIQILSTGSMLEATDYKVYMDYVIFQNYSNTFTYEFYPDADNPIKKIGVKPINSIISVTQDGNTWVEDTDYYYYDGKFEPITSIDNYRKPFILDLNVGYTDIPYDLKQAFYEYVEFLFDSRDRKTHIIKSVATKEGGTTSYKTECPYHISDTFKRYSPFGLTFS